jgi:hypothetical protein
VWGAVIADSGLSIHMGIFSQRFVIDSVLPVQDAWRNLLPVVKTDLPICAECGQTLAGAVRFCSNCGQPAPPPLPQTWVQRHFYSGGFEFEGDVSPQAFNISRIISYRNSCIPVIRGRFEPSAARTRIVIEMKMHPLGYVFLVGGTTISFVVLSILAVNGQGVPVTAVAAFAAPCFIFTVCWVAFAVEAGTARAALSRFWPIH